jgi:hypothetical protein
MVSFATLSFNVIAGTNTMSAGTTWEDGIWSAGHMPTSGEDAIISPGLIVTINSAAVCASLTIAATGQLIISAANSLTISGSLQNDGTFTAGANTTLTFNGSGNSTITGSGTFTVNYMVLNMSTKTTILDIQSSNFINGIDSTSGYNFTFIQGTFKNNNTATLTDCHNNGVATALTIPFNVIIESDLGTLNLCRNGANGSVILSGKLYINGGTVNVLDGQALNSGYDFVYQVNGGTPQLYVNSGTLSVGSGFHASGGTDYIDFNMSGGSMTLADQGMSFSYTFQLANVAGGSTTMTGGTIMMQDACYADLPDIDMGGANVASYSVTGGSVQFGNLQTQGGSTYFGIQPNGAHNYPNFDFQGGVAKSVSPWCAGDFSVISIYICSAMTFDVSNYNPNVTFIGTNGTFALNNSGTFNMGSGTFIFNCPTTSQLVTGTSINTFSNVIINNHNGVIFWIPTIITGMLTLTNGNLTINTNAITFQDGNTPIVRTNGTMSWTNAADLVFGTPGHTGGNAFTIPTGAFLGSNPTLDDFTINRDQRLVLSENMVVQGTLTLTSGILDISGIALIFDIGNVPISVGTGSITVSPATSISFGQFHSTGGNAFTIPSNTFTGAIPPSINNFSVYRNNSLTLGQPITVNNLTISAGSLDVSTNNYAITVNGNWTNNGTFVPEVDTVTLSGNAFQRIDGTSVTNFYNLILNNTSGTSPQFKLIRANVIIRNQLTMIAGNVNLAGFTLTLGTAPGTGILSHTGTAASGWLYGGNFTRYFNTPNIADRNVAGMFPIGSATDFRPFYVSYPSTCLTTGGTITFTHTNATTVSNVNFPDGASTVVRRHDAFWTCATGGGIAVAGTPFDLSIEGMGFGLICAVSDLVLTLADSVVGIDGINAGTTINPQINRTGLSLADLANNFYPASISMNSPLPIELLSFDAICNGDKVKLNWTTASETNNDFFSIYESADAEIWNLISTISGAGNSNHIINYSITDNDYHGNTAYYRLKQTDYNGSVTWFNISSVDCPSSNEVEMTIYPNPFSTSATIMISDASQINNYELKIYNVLGTEVMNTIVRNQSTTLETSNLPTGIYSYKVIEKNKTIQSGKLISQQ